MTTSIPLHTDKKYGLLHLEVWSREEGETQLSIPDNAQKIKAFPQNFYTGWKRPGVSTQ